MSERRPLSYKWILFGAGVIVGLNYLVRALLADPVRSQLLESFDGTMGLYVYAGLVAFLSFFVGGAVVGYWSPGETIKEPALASAVAVTLNAIDNFGNVDGRNFTVLQWLVGTTIVGFVGLVMAFAGAWVGEKAQGGTEQKDKEYDGAPPEGTA
jgi:hypothetical protein